MCRKRRTNARIFCEAFCFSFDLCSPVVLLSHIAFSLSKRLAGKAVCPCLWCLSLTLSMCDLLFNFIHRQQYPTESIQILWDFYHSILITGLWSIFLYCIFFCWFRYLLKSLFRFLNILLCCFNIFYRISIFRFLLFNIVLNIF